jgi:uncharacterized protein VirK/YbjX
MTSTPESRPAAGSRPGSTTLAPGSASGQGALRREAPWPGGHDLFPGSGLSRKLRRLKYALRVLRARPHLEQLRDQVVATPAWLRLFENEPRLYYPLVTRAVDRRLGLAQRSSMFRHDLTTAHRVFGEAICALLAERRPWAWLALGDEWQLVLEVNAVSFHEGFWSVCLRHRDGGRAYHAGFAFQPDRRVLIAGIQGPRGHEWPGHDPKDIVRDLTKLCEGLRPPHLLLEGIRAVALAAGATELVGIDPRHHIKGAWNHRGKRLKFDYAEFWTEGGGTVDADGNWRLPLVGARRDLADAPSKKRAMYRRRYALLDQLAAHWQTRGELAAVALGAASEPAAQPPKK